MFDVVQCTSVERKALFWSAFISGVQWLFNALRHFCGNICILKSELLRLFTPHYPEGIKDIPVWLYDSWLDCRDKSPNKSPLLQMGFSDRGNKGVLVGEPDDWRRGAAPTSVINPGPERATATHTHTFTQHAHTKNAWCHWRFFFFFFEQWLLMSNHTCRTVAFGTWASVSSSDITDMHSVVAGRQGLNC